MDGTEGTRATKKATEEATEATGLPRWGSAEDARAEENRAAEARRLALEKAAEKVGATVTQVVEAAAEAEAAEAAEAEAGQDAAAAAAAASSASRQRAASSDAGGRTTVDPSEDPLGAMEASLAITEQVRAPPRGSTLLSKGEVASSASSAAHSIAVSHRINRKIALWTGDICRLSIDAIVNTSNERIDDRRGLSGRVFRVAGAGMAEEVQRCAPEGCRTGSSVATRGCELPCSAVIHTVGPRWNDKYATAAENALHGCYRSSLRVLLELGLATIAFPCVYTERKKYPRAQAVHTVLRTVRRFLENFGDRVVCVVFAVENDADRVDYENTLPLYFPRNDAELSRSKKELPRDLGNEWGELVIRERKIRINFGTQKQGGAAGALPGEEAGGDASAAAAAAADQQRRTSSLLKMDDDFVTMMGDMDKDRLAKLEAAREGSADGDVDEDEMHELYQAYLGEAEGADLSDIMRMQLFYKPGVDNQDRPVFVIVLKHVPPGIDMHRAFLYAIQKMDKVVDQEYVVVLVMSLSVSESRPSFTWLQQMYHVFDNRYRKNMKNLYVLHPSIWFKLALWFMSPLLSSSIWNKIVYVHEVRDLFHMFHPNQLLLPEFVFRYDREINASSYSTVGQHEEL